MTEHIPIIRYSRVRLSHTLKDQFDKVLDVRVKGRVAVIWACLVPMCAVIVVAKLGSLFKAVASSFKVPNVAGAEFTRLATAVDKLASVE